MVVLLAQPTYEDRDVVGDQILGVAGKTASSQPDFYRQLWQAGKAGDPIDLTVLRDGSRMDFRVRSADRMNYLKRPEGV